jgi:hypothetical protein
MASTGGILHKVDLGVNMFTNENKANTFYIGKKGRLTEKRSKIKEIKNNSK